MVRALAWSLLGVVLVSVYGTEVCPILEGIGAVHLSRSVLAAFAAGELAALWITRSWIDGAPAAAQMRRTYQLAMARHVVVGALIAAWDVWGLGIPISNGLKVLAAVVTFGHFVGVDLALARERRVLVAAGTEGAGIATHLPETRSMVRRLALFASTSVVLVVSITGFLIVRDLDVLAAARSGAVGGARDAVQRELAAVGVVVAAMVLDLIVSFARNVGLLFENQTRVLSAVGAGDLARGVPVVTDDEFGVIAAHTNRMIEGLRDRQKVRDALGKIVSPDVARALLEGEGGPALGGSRRTLTLLFSDIRGFTSWSEGTEPEVLVADLNRYFTEMVRIVHEEGGIVDKFIGDGMMAVFGLGGEAGASAAAARAALRMEEALAKLNPTLSRPLRIGVGLHRGAVIAGNIGAPDRLEFTVIGDTVNTAARLESLTAKLGCAILLSGAVRDDLPEADRARWVSRGAHELKGKSAAVEVFASSSD